jgi:hypothetical protein
MKLSEGSFCYSFCLADNTRWHAVAITRGLA